MTNFNQVSQDDYNLLTKIIYEAAKLLPCQAPLQSFVHHNTLHNFESLQFKDALKAAAERFGSNCFMSEEFFQQAFLTKRITSDDLEKIILDECINATQPIAQELPNNLQFRKWRLANLYSVPNSSSLNWFIYENKILSKPHRLCGSATLQDSIIKKNFTKKELLALWNILAVKNSTTTKKNQSDLERQQFTKSLRLRDKILLHYNIDIDELTKPTLIKLAGAYLDQGVAFNAMPHRENGFLHTFRKIYSSPAIASESWTKYLSNECKNQELHSFNAHQIIIRILNLYGISLPDWKEFILQSLLSLRGWAGMFYQYEIGPEKIPVHFVPAKIIDFLAVQLSLEFAATKFTLEKIGIDFEELSKLNFIEKNSAEENAATTILQYESFIAAQAFGLLAQHFTTDSVKKWHETIANFNDFEQRYNLLLAYENHHRQATLDGLISQQNFNHDTPKNRPTLTFQAIFCMDEREESLRRHLEEICDSVETYGFAGFFGVAMQYKGLDDIRPKPLCPVAITPHILVEEVALNHHHSYKYAKTRKVCGKIFYNIRKARKSLIPAALWACLIGPFKIIPLAGRSLFPLFAAKTLKFFHTLIGIHNKPETILNIECIDNEARKFGFKVGFSLDEMANIVFGVLDAMGLKNNLAPLVILVGHGSSTINNPHESAYNCGATGGGKGSANARAFTMMANDIRVREKLKARGLDIPSSTRFIGAYHDTCSDEMEFYDIAQTNENNESFQKQFNYAKSMLAQACKDNARERCRRFDSVPKKVSATQAKLYVEQRAIDLAQPRPEYGHGTNAVCIIGRREKTTNLFLDRRAFLISYNPLNDADGSILANILKAAVPVGAGISLEYYFSSIDPFNYGCNTKLPHNVTGLIAVMDGAASDLRTGLPWQTVELHEPMRLLTIIEATPATLLKIAKDNHEVGQLVKNNWIQLVAWNHKNNEFRLFHKGNFIKL